MFVGVGGLPYGHGFGHPSVLLSVRLGVWGTVQGEGETDGHVPVLAFVFVAVRILEFADTWKRIFVHTLKAYFQKLFFFESLVVLQKQSKPNEATM